MFASFVMIREKTDAATLAEYGPKASLLPQGHPLKPLAIYDAPDQLELDAIEGAMIIMNELQGRDLPPPHLVNKHSRS